MGELCTAPPTAELQWHKWQRDDEGPPDYMSGGPLRYRTPEFDSTFARAYKSSRVEPWGSDTKARIVRMARLRPGVFMGTIDGQWLLAGNSRDMERIEKERSKFPCAYIRLVWDGHIIYLILVEEIPAVAGAIRNWVQGTRTDLRTGVSEGITQLITNALNTHRRREERRADRHPRSRYAREGLPYTQRG